MGNCFGEVFYSSDLIGMDLITAKNFIENNIVYYDKNARKYQIKTIDVIIPNSIISTIYIPNRLNVYSDDNKIIEVCDMG